MGVELGTRSKQNFRKEHPETSRMSKSYTRDVGMSKNVTASMTFVPGSNQIQAAGGTFAAFAAGDEILCQGTNLNNGYFVVTSTDASTQLTVDGNVATEGPISATVRTR